MKYDMDYILWRFIYACANLFSGMPRELTDFLTEISAIRQAADLWKKKQVDISEEPFFGAPFSRKLFSTIVLIWSL